MVELEAMLVVVQSTAKDKPQCLQSTLALGDQKPILESNLIHLFIKFHNDNLVFR